MAFSNAKVKLPSVFIEKINIDNTIKDMLRQSLVDFKLYKGRKDEQSRIRFGCEEFIKKSRKS